ncbi:hypothetical protein [Achromobacter sp.]|uniref:hypothetical protein n=1 Tax=Achromobacter sp. TaxID=134375 RepID=UPI003C767A47
MDKTPGWRDGMPRAGSRYPGGARVAIGESGDQPRKGAHCACAAWLAARVWKWDIRWFMLSPALCIQAIVIDVPSLQRQGRGASNRMLRYGGINFSLVSLDARLSIRADDAAARLSGQPGTPGRRLVERLLAPAAPFVLG